MPQRPSYWTVLSMLEWATGYFEENDVKSPRMSIEWLLAHVLSIKRLDLYLNYDRPLTNPELEELRPLVKRRAAHEPLQYIIGETDFHHVKIKVKPGVLIPRQETEQLVEIILSNHRDEALEVIDIGTGSGCIPIALKAERNAWEMNAIDISDSALQIAKDNAALNNVKIDFYTEDIFKPIKTSAGKHFDIIVSNPPYILEDEKETLDSEVLDYEPKEALFCSSTNEIYGAIEQFAKVHLKPYGHLYLELHEKYADEVLGLFTKRKWKADIQEDYQGKPRFLIAAHF